jgi:hypothetical protein
MNFNRILTKLANADLTEEQEAQLEQLLTSKAKPDEQGQKADTPNPNEAEKVDNKGEEKSQEVESTDTDTKVEENETEELGKKEETSPEVEQNAVDSQEKAKEDVNGQVIEETKESRFDGRPITDFALNVDVDDKLKALEAKFNAIVDENVKLRKELDESKKKADDLHTKYETNGFGNLESKTNVNKDKPTSANSFSAYWNETH